MSLEVELYGADEDDSKLLYERACSRYLELLEETGKPPRLQTVADRLVDAHSDEYPSPGLLINRLSTPAFQEELRIRRKEHLITSLAPRLFMAEMAAGVGKLALEEMVDRLKDEESRSTISNRDLNSILKTVAELALAGDRAGEEASTVIPTNKGTIINFISQFDSPERAAVVLQEMARLDAAKERSGGRD